MIRRTNALAGIGAAFLLTVSPLGMAQAQTTTTTTFSDGTEGWVGPFGTPSANTTGTTTFPTTGGNPTDHAFVSYENFFFSFRNSTNPAFVRDLTPYDSVQISIDVKVDSIFFFGSEVSRPLVLELRDKDNDSEFPWDSVWFDLGEISAATHGDWATLSVTIDDPSATALPAGWGGYGDELGIGQPILPPDRDFADILSTYDEIAFVTITPEFASPFIEFGVRFDNVSITTVPEPSSLALLALAGVVTGRRRRARAAA